MHASVQDLISQKQQAPNGLAGQTASTGVPAALPWEWFSFSPADSGGGGGEIGHVRVAGQPVPFRYLRRPATGENGHPTQRPAIILLHGMGLTIASFRGVSGYLLQTHDLILPDYSGFSGTGFTEPPSLKGFAAGVWQLADHLGIERVSLAGNSLGGGLCITAALMAPERVECMLFSNPACFPQRLPSMYRLVRYPLLGELFMAITPAGRFVGGVEKIGYVDKSQFDPALKQIYLDSLALPKNRLRLMEIIRQLPADERDLAAAMHLGRLAELKMPVLISWGEQDPLLSEGAGVRLAAALPGAQLEVHPDLAHIPHEEAPERIGKRWAEFLGEHKAGPAEKRTAISRPAG